MKNSLTTVIASTLFLFTVATTSANAEAVSFSGGDLQRRCQAQDRVDSRLGDRDDDANAGFCLGFMMGMLASIRNYQYDPTAKVCPPDNVTAGQLRQIVMLALAAYPQMLHLSSEIVAFDAIRTAFPCTK